MTWVDWTILAIIGVSMVISVFRGLAREVLSLLAWVAAGWAALHYSHDAAAWIAPWVPVPSVRLLIGGGALFTVVLLVLGLVNVLIGQLVRSTGLSGTDRSLGVIFGLARGVAIVTVLVLAAGVTAVPEDPWWKESMLLRHFEDLAVEVREVLPDPVADLIHYPGEAGAVGAPVTPPGGRGVGAGAPARAEAARALPGGREVGAGAGAGAPAPAAARTQAVAGPGSGDALPPLP